MKEFILLNEVTRYTNNDSGEIIRIECIEQLLLPVSRIVHIRALRKEISKNLIDDSCARKQIIMMADDDLRGSKIVYIDENTRNNYLIVLETPEAIYNQMYSE
ncbi:MAG: hypothetical protein J6B87_06940 [Clostridia bacterium]|nr:hypothetical protein [Clostridia bacterium]